MHARALRLFVCLFTAGLAGPPVVCAQNHAALHRQITTLFVASNADGLNRQFVVRFIPEFEAGHELTTAWRVDFDAAATARVSVASGPALDRSTSRDADLYRAWARLPSAPRRALVAARVPNGELRWIDPFEHDGGTRRRID